MTGQRLCVVLKSIRKNSFFRDSSWAVFGNSIGYGLLLLTGMLVARFLGKDLYGEYGFVKTTMFQFAAFSTLGLGYTSTKFIAEHRTSSPEKIAGIIKASIQITSTISFSIAIILFIFAKPLALFLNEPSLQIAFQALGTIVILRAIYTTQIGLISGFGEFKNIAFINVVFGASLLALSIPTTFYWGLKGALGALLVSHIIVVIICFYFIFNQKKQFSNIVKPCSSPIWEITRFSIPVAMQELTYALGRWGGVLLITKLSTLGEVGLFTASELWMSVVLFIPTFLSNVMLSHLSYNSKDKQSHIRSLKVMIGVNVTCTLIPFVLFYILSPWIAYLYGTSFSDMIPVMRILVFSSIFTCCSNVFSAELIAQGQTWGLFGIRAVRDIATIALGYSLIYTHEGNHAAYDYAISTLFCSILFLGLLYIYFRMKINPNI